jgi:peptide/nickel transport system permease protein
MLAHIRHVLGVDRPFWVQYWIYLRGIILHFNLGYSYQFAQPVTAMIVNGLPATISLTVGAVAIWVRHRHGGGSDLGRLPPQPARPPHDDWVTPRDLCPDLLAGSHGAVPVLNGHRRDPHLRRRRHLRRSHRQPRRWFGSLILPWLVLAAMLAAFYARLLRSQLIEAMSQDDIRTARAKGLRERQVIWHHGMRAAITPIVTVLGMDIGFLLGGAVVVQTVFNIPGVGRLAYEGINQADLPIIQGTVQLGAFFIVIANLIVDVAYAFLDPRVRYS